MAAPNKQQGGSGQARSLMHPQHNVDAEAAAESKVVVVVLQRVRRVQPGGGLSGQIGSEVRRHGDGSMQRQ